MPHSYQSTGGAGGSVSPGRITLSAPNPPQLTKSQPKSPVNARSAPPSAANEGRIQPNSGLNSPAEDVNPPPGDPDSDGPFSPLLADLYPLEADVFSLDATERFPEGIFRMPLPNAVFQAMSSLSGSALRAALALYHRSHHFDPETGWWTQANRGLLRAAIQQAAGLSEQGTRDGLKEIETRGWIEVDRTGRSYRYQWTMRTLRPHEGGYTYVPTALLDALSADGDPDRPGHTASTIASTPELRVILTVLRWTWGFTRRVHTADGQPVRVHDRWKALSTPGLARYAGCSESAAKRAAKALQGRWIERVRPGHGTYQYRFLPEAVRFGPPTRLGPPQSPSGKAKTGCGETFFSGDSPNEIPPDPPSDPPPSIKTPSQRDTSTTQHIARGKRKADKPSTRRSPRDRRAVRHSSSREQGLPSRTVPDVPLNLETLPNDQRRWAQTLQNVGISSYRTRQILRRYAPERIEANFELYRQRASKTSIKNPGGYLAQAITEGWALPTQGSGAESGTSSLPPLEAKDTVSAAERDAYIETGVPAGAFYSRGEGPSGEEQFMYLPNGPRHRR